MKDSALELELLKTLSHFEAMSMEFILIDFDESFLVSNPEFTKDDLEECLKSLQKQNKIKRIVENKQEKWIKLFPKKSIFKHLINKILS